MRGDRFGLVEGAVGFCLLGIAAITAIIRMGGVALLLGIAGIGLVACGIGRMEGR